MFAAMVVLLLPTGCVRRRLNVRSNPPGALVFIDNQQIGTTPCSVDFIYYGTREIRLVKPGFETLTVNQPIPMPWYQIPPIDFVSENLVPARIMDHRTVSFDMQPQIVVPTEQLLDRANQLRQETQQIAASAPAVVAPAGVPVGAPTIAPGAVVPGPGVQGPGMQSSVPPSFGGPPMESVIQPGQVSPPGGFAPTPATQPSFAPAPVPLPPTGSAPPATYNPAAPATPPTAPFGAPSLPPDASIPPATNPYAAPQTLPQQTFPPTTLPPTATPGTQQGPPIVSPPLR
jgi:hypothetical protein